MTLSAEERTAIALRPLASPVRRCFGRLLLSPPVADNDLWGHIYFGDSILKSGHLPTSNQYSFTAPDHPWITTDSR